MRAVVRLSGSMCLLALIAVGCAPDPAAEEQEAACAGGKCDGPIGDAPLATAIGPFDSLDHEYRFEAKKHEDVLGDRNTEIWAHVWRPTQLGTTTHPVLVFLHGNHATCGSWAGDVRRDTSCAYSSTGTCPAGMEVVPNHMGYDYLAQHLATWGYVVVSINANRGITCDRGVSGDGGLNLARGRLVLKHLEILSKWNNADDTDDAYPLPDALKDLQGKLDFDNVGMMGHSRGGEGVRAAYVQYRDEGSEWPAKISEPVTFNGIFEIGPVDGQTGRTLDAPGTPWAVLLPMCDGDVSNLQGMQHFDRLLNGEPETTPAPKAMFAAWGTNHNFFNLQWMESDSPGCSGEGHEALFEREAQDRFSDQVKVGLSSMAAFFRAHTGPKAHRAFNRTFDPLYALSPALLDLTSYERAYADATSVEGRKLLQAFKLKAEELVPVAANAPEGDSYAPYTASDVTFKISSVSEHDAVQRAAQLSWSPPAEGDAVPSFETVWAAPGTGVDLCGMAYVGFRVSRRQDELNPVTPTDFSVQLVGDSGQLSSPVAVGDYASLVGPVGGPYGSHYVLQSVRVPLQAFASLELGAVRGVRFVFDRTPTGAIYLADISAGKELVAPAATLPANNGGNNVPGTVVPPGNNIVHNPGNANNTVVDVTPDPNGTETLLRFYSDARFWIGDTLPALVIGDKRFTLSTPAAGGTDTMIAFHVPTADFEALVAATPDANVAIEYGPEGQPQERWDFGPISVWQQ